MRNRFLLTTLLALFATPLFAQDQLSLSQAIDKALSQNPAIRAARATTAEAAERVTQARAGYLPRLELVEGAQSGNQPVFAFSSLLAERRFSPADFAIGSLNHPNAVTNFRTGLSIEQPIFDGFRTRAATSAAEIGRTIAETQQAQTRQDLALNTTRAYGQVLLAGAVRRAAEAAVEAAEEDLKRAERRRDAGLASEADVLSLQVHLAEMRARAIGSASDETVARAQLNQAIGEPLDRQFALEDVVPGRAPLPPLADLEQEGLRARPELRTAQLQEALARETQRGARGALLPQVSLQGFFELNGNGEAFGSRASAWLIGAQARWTIFSGMSDIARLRETARASERASADREQADTAIRVDVRTAAARVQSAAAREQVGEAAVAQARESQRIIRDRYDAGMASVNDVLRAANAVLDADSQRIGAHVDLLISNAMLDRALGRTPGSN